MKCQETYISGKSYRLLNCRKKALFNLNDKFYCKKHFDEEEREIRLAKIREYNRLRKLKPDYIQRQKRLKKEKALAKKLEEQKKLDEYWKRFPIKETAETYLKELRSFSECSKDQEKNYIHYYGELKFLEILKHNYRFDCRWDYGIELLRYCEGCGNHMPLRMLNNSKKICPYCIKEKELIKLNKPSKRRYSLKNLSINCIGGSK